MRIIEFENRCTGNRTVGFKPTLSANCEAFNRFHLTHEGPQIATSGTLAAMSLEASTFQVAARPHPKLGRSEEQIRRSPGEENSGFFFLT